MEAINQATGEVRKVIRERRGVAWCPFCDRSRLVATTGPFCDGCRCEFRDAVVEEVEEVQAPPRRRRATVEEVEENTAEEVVADAVSEEAEAE